MSGTFVRSLSCSGALRTLGQELEARGWKSFAIYVQPDAYLMEAGVEPAPSPATEKLQYTFKQIRELDWQRGQKREKAPRNSDVFTLAQTLRALGAYIDKKNGRLLRISNNDCNPGETLFRIEYEMPDGKRVVEDFSGAAAYDLCVGMYKRRGKR